MTDEAKSLEDVYTEYNIQEPQRQPDQSEKQQPAIVAESAIAQELAALKKGLGEVQAQNKRLHEEAVARQDQDDLQGVLETLGKKLDGVKSNHIKYALAEKYETDPKFKAVWDSRSQNPEAFNAAIEAVVPVLQEDLAVKADPKIAEDQRAFDNALQGADTAVEADDETRRLMKMKSGEFDRAWRDLVTG